MTQLEMALPAHNGTSTSVAAAESVRESAATLRAKVLAHLRERLVVARGGSTDEEMQRELGMQGNTQRPRRRELEKAGLIEDSGVDRPTLSGRWAAVWRIK